MRSEIVVLCVALGVGSTTALANAGDLKPIALKAAPTKPAGESAKLLLLRGNQSRVEVGPDGNVLAAGEPVGTRITTSVEFTSNGGPPRSKLLAKMQAQDASCQAALAAPPAPDRRV